MTNIRIGFGYDMHKLKSGNSIVLAGVAIDSKYTVEAHSDGDIVLHSLSDAIYGSLAEGDIGIHFPSNSDNINIDSKIILNHAYKFRKKVRLNCHDPRIHFLYFFLRLVCILFFYNLMNNIFPSP